MSMQTTDIEHDIRTFLVDTFLLGRGDELGEDSPLMDRVIDSHGVVELVVFLQERFGIRVEDEEVNRDNLDSLKKVVAFVTKKLGSKG
jgi:acyl carrier protein